MAGAILNYGELTWPEVAALPRDTALVLPLGATYDSERATTEALR